MRHGHRSRTKIPRHRRRRSRAPAASPGRRASGNGRRRSDRYFAHPSRDFARTDEALRLRRIGEFNFITYKGPKLDATTKTRREIEIGLADGQQAATDAAELLAAIGFHHGGGSLQAARATSP